MNEVVRCHSCHRREHWKRDGDAVHVTVGVVGGGRAPVLAPEASAFLTALQAYDEGLAVVGTCAACGQPLVGDPGWGAEARRVDTPDGAFTVDATGVRASSGPVSAAEAREAVEAAYRPSALEGLGGDLAKASFFVVLTPIFVGWVFACLFVLSFLMAIYEWAPRAVSDDPTPPPAELP